MHEALRDSAPRYVSPFLKQLPRARRVVLHRLLSALWREDFGAIRTASRRIDTTTPVVGYPDPSALGASLLGASLSEFRVGVWVIHELGATAALAFPVRAEHAFDNLKAHNPMLSWRDRGVAVIEAPHELVELLAEHAPIPAWRSFAAELADTVANLALAFARSQEQREALRQVAAELGAPDTMTLARRLAARCSSEDTMVFFERLNTEGHNLHPCGRGRLGMRPVDLLRHDLESDISTDLILVAISRDRVESTPDERGRDVGQLLWAEYPALGTAVREHCRAAQLDPEGYVFVPVHRWQLDQVVRPLLAEEIAEGAVVPVPAARLAGVPTSSVRTLLTEPSPKGGRLLVKTALDTLIGSTRRSISAHTTNNGPVYSRLLRRIIDGEPGLSDRVVLLDELAGASYRPRAHESEPDRRSRALSALVRSGLSIHLRPGELPVPSCALPARAPVTGSSLLTELVTRFAVSCGEGDLGAAGLRFAHQYATLLLPVSVILMTKYGIAVEAHLQNCIITFADAVPARLVLRDWGGMRIYPPRLRRHGLSFDPRPGAATVTDDVQVMRAKMLYTVLSNHLG
ncbi:MAG TPA: IucA/IucC family protein, partial [Pseudonocardiaceae bacterium]|nr:IucA/IucC family protein [Pseudonocardiaceae bacterium]